MSKAKPHRVVGQCEGRHVQEVITILLKYKSAEELKPVYDSLNPTMKVAADFISSYYFSGKDISKLRDVTKAVKFESSSGGHDFEVHYRRKQN